VLCLVTDRNATRRPLPEAVAAAVAGGVDWVQLRERGLPGAALLELALAVARAARAADPGVRILVNRRVDVALAAGLDGVHLGFDAMSAATARALLGPQATLGVASHAAEELACADTDLLDYAHLAPIQTPRSKPSSRVPLGMAALHKAASHGLPVLAQGGIHAGNAAACIAAGAAGVAVTGALLASDNPKATARALREALDA